MLLSFFFLFLAFLSSPAVAHPNFPGGCSALTGHGVGSYMSDMGYWKLELDGGNTASPNDRVVVKLYDYGGPGGPYPFQGYIFKTSAGTLTAKSSPISSAMSSNDRCPCGPKPCHCRCVQSSLLPEAAHPAADRRIASRHPLTLACSLF